MTARTSREGFAAALAVCLLAGLGGIAAASFYAVSEARRSATRSARQQEAATAADGTLFSVLDQWDADADDSLLIGATDSTAGYVTRLTKRVYWIAARGEAAPGTSVHAIRRYNLLMEVLQPQVPTGAAITSAGAVLSGPQVLIDGADSAPPGWADCPPADTASAPPILISDDSATFVALGRVALSALAARADITLAPGATVTPAPDVANGCQRSAGGGDTASWGEPGRGSPWPDCERFSPVVHARGDLTVASGRGQGALLVSGHLRIRGPFVFYGVVIAAEGIEASGSDVTVYGAVLSGGPRGVAWDAPGDVRRSTCAVSRASRAAARPYPVPLRWWSELF